MADPFYLETGQLSSVLGQIDSDYIVQALGDARAVLDEVRQEVSGRKVNGAGSELLRWILLEVISQVHGYTFSAKSFFHPCGKPGSSESSSRHSQSNTT